MVLLIDNFDSFVYNLARYLRELGEEVRVVRNDAIDVAGVRELAPDHLVISPGPCTPAEAGVSTDLVRELSGEVPVLGVCLGHQCIARAFGGRVVRASEPRHGKASRVRHDGTDLFTGLADPLRVIRYHSLLVDEESLPPELAVTARSEEGSLMALRHRERPAWGVQFHPEAVLTDHGHALLRNFLALGRGEAPPGPDAGERFGELEGAASS